MPAPSLAKVDDRVAAAAQQALQALTKNRRCAAFVFEVDPEELGLFNYFKIITEPMHLDLVLQKLQVTPRLSLRAFRIPSPCPAEKGVQNGGAFPPRCGAGLQERHGVQSA
jgi:hypothetical protein